MKFATNCTENYEWAAVMVAGAAVLFVPICLFVAHLVVLEVWVRIGLLAWDGSSATSSSKAINPW